MKNDDKYLPSQIAEKIAQPRVNTQKQSKFEKHHKEFSDPYYGNKTTKINNRKDYQSHIVKIMNDPATRVYRSAALKRDLYYHAKSNSLVVRDPGNKEYGGTCFRVNPKKGKVKYVAKEIRRDLDYRKKNGLPKGRIVRGGYPALMKHLEQQSTQTKQPQKSKAERLSGGRRKTNAPASKRSKTPSKTQATTTAPSKKTSKSARIRGSGSSSRSRGGTKPARTQKQTRSKD